MTMSCAQGLGGEAADAGCHAQGEAPINTNNIHVQIQIPYNCKNIYHTSVNANTIQVQIQIPYNYEYEYHTEIL